MEPALFEWAVLEATVNGRSCVGMPGVRDPEYPCEAFAPGEPGYGRCDTDGHYMCMECKEMSDETLCFRTEVCREHRTKLVKGCCLTCDAEDVLLRAAELQLVRTGTRS
jgi:hypothetical protein